jgi:CubicO group peptidase (beta-lactamase class C family)
VNKLSRREFIYGCSGAAAAVVVGCDPAIPPQDALDGFIGDEMLRNHIPGLAISAVKGGALAWSRGFGWANIEQQIAMTPETMQNIGSVSKPIVTTVLMQCAERGMLSLDEDVNNYLPFSIRNPSHPNVAITFTQLLSHYSSIADGSSYGRAYACGESNISLQEWIEGYFLSDGAYHDAAENFHAWAPGEQYEYNNVAFSVLAYLVQVITDTPFDEYCREELFAPLGMSSTSWFVKNIDKSRHATPYAYVSEGKIDSPSWGGIELGLLNGEQPPVDFEGPYADCVYDHPNFADGFLRTSVDELTKFQLMLIAGGVFNGHRILKEKTVRQMLTGHGITWHARELPDGAKVWGHGGGDPGVSTLFEFQPDTGDGVIIFANTHGASLDDTSAYLFSKLAESIDT